MPETIPAAALNQHIAILGKTGSGKSYAAKGIVEGLLDSKRQVCVLDPTGAWWGLRLAADGKARGYDVVLLGGKHADIPLAERSGEAVARLVTEQLANVVIDTTGFTVGEYTRWFTDFAGTLYTTIRNPLHLVIDEAHYFAPQGKAPDPAAGKMIHACNRLMSGGRSLGIRGMLITQRPAKLHKDSLTCADTLIAMRVLAPQDRQAIKDWIDGAGDREQGKAILDSLAGLQKGEGWVWYPEGGHLQRVTFPKISTYDSSATPAHGAKAGPKVAEIDLSAVRASMAEAVKEAEANDPKLLRAKIADLSKQLSKTGQGVQKSDPAAIEKAVTAALAARDREWQSAIKERDGIIDGLKGRMGKAASILNVNGEAVPSRAVPSPQANRVIHGEAAASPHHRERHKAGVLTDVSTQLAKSPASRAVSRDRASTSAAGASETQLGKCERAILQVLSQFPEGCQAGKLTLLAGYRYSGGFRNSLGTLRTAGLIAGENGGTMTITEAGLACGPFEPLPEGQALVNYWLNHNSLGKCERQILAALIEAPDGMTADQLCQATGYQFSGGFRNSLGALRTAGLLVGSNRDVMTASEELLQ